MSIEFDIYTGTLKYKEIEFSFVFDRKELRLIPPEDKYHDVHMWFMKPLGKEHIHLETQCILRMII